MIMVYRVMLQNIVDVELTTEDFAKIGQKEETASTKDINNLLHSKLGSIIDYDLFTWQKKDNI